MCIGEADALDIMRHFERFSYHKGWRHYRYDYQSATRNNHPKIQFALYDTVLGRFILDDLGYRRKSIGTFDKVLAFMMPELHHHFWRGYFDGDGHILAPATGKHRLTITSTYEQDWSVVEALAKSLGVKCKVRRKVCKKHGHRSSVVDVQQLDSIKRLLDYLYQSYDQHGIGLKRKHDRYLEVLEKHARTVALKHSKHRGVTYNTANRKWRAFYCVGGIKNGYLGSFSTELEALAARQAAELAHRPVSI